jgi:hypothetical protein
MNRRRRKDFQEKDTRASQFSQPSFSFVVKKVTRPWMMRFVAPLNAALLLQRLTLGMSSLVRSVRCTEPFRKGSF